jgi:hypothetical protein
MAAIEARLTELGLMLPAPTKMPSGARLPFSWVRVRGNRAFVSGHGALNEDGSLAGPLGKVGDTAPGFDQLPSVINGCSDLILTLYGPERGDHARSAVGGRRSAVGGRRSAWPCCRLGYLWRSRLKSK